MDGPEQHDRPSEDVAEVLAGALEREGEIDSRGRFTLDPQRAWAKLRAFALGDPSAYVLLLIEAAVLANPEAPAIRLATRADVGPLSARGLVVTFLGLGLAEDELRELFTAALGGREDPRARTLRAIGRSVVSAGAGRVEIDNVGPDRRRRRLAVDADGASVLGDRGESSNPIGWTRVLFERRTGTELELIRERCRLSTVAITLDDDVQDFGPSRAFADTLVPGVDVVDASNATIGYAGIVPGARVGQVHVLARGVLVETLTPDDARPGFVAVVDVDLPTDLAHAKLIRNEAFAELRARVRAAHDALAWTEHRHLVEQRKQGRHRSTNRWALVGISVVLLAVLGVSPWVVRSLQRDSLAVLRHSCLSVSTASCFRYIDEALDVADPDERREATLLLVHACRRGDAMGCIGVLTYAEQHGQLAREAASRGCELGRAHACVFDALEAFAVCEESGACERAHLVAERTCEKYQGDAEPNLATAVGGVCTLAGLLNRYGYGGARDHAGSQRYFTLACAAELDERAGCATIGAPPAELGACEAGDGYTCYALGVAALGQSELAPAGERFAAACEAGLEPGCEIASYIERFHEPPLTVPAVFP